MQPQTFAFDIYGTLIDTEGVKELLDDFLGAKAKAFSDLWRNKQLEYSFRRGLMNQYVDFSICTREALQFACDFTRFPLTHEQKDELMQAYRVLPAFTDVPACLEKLKNQGHQIFAFSNGSLAAIHELLKHADLQSFFDGAVSMETIKTFKPNPLGYQHFIKTSGAQKDNAWLVSGNSFDVVGAAAFGMNTVWLRRKAHSVMDPMGYDPTLILKNLVELPGEIKEFLLP